MKKDSKIFIAGHKGLVGSAIMKVLKTKGYENLLTKTRAELDLTDSAQTQAFFEKEMPEYIFLAAAKVGGINANNLYRADFIYQNLAIQNNVIYNAYKYHAKKLLFLGSSCIYPKHSPQPIKESYLLTNELEYTNEPYAIAKITGLKMCEAFSLQYGCNFISAMPTNLYGENDNFDLETSHVLPALIRKFYEAKSNNSDTIVLWGSGNPRREFLYSLDMAKACVYIMENIDFKDLAKDLKTIKNTHINIGYGSDISIKELALLIQKISGFKGKIVFDPSKPDGTYQKLLDSSKINNLGWEPEITLEKGIQKVYEWYLEQK
ncbi:GDP-fucose synthetase [Helicobacter sp. 12S02232-10]|uniref:GDP-L-fucose synthase family protein n=1 Tax=Helicobacter sp. 12S02232-10 TaxID=1476197 RepID=UPI000BA69FF5|nr:GDP-L-fucose synthase [Helicobacter sp. 12S02232-10]PAF48959.1 GDP-fucose synthetase [Helicobacter sp. 12S02232-10]